MRGILLTLVLVSSSAFASEECKSPKFMQWKSTESALSLQDIPTDSLIARQADFVVLEGDEIQLHTSQSFVQNSSDDSVQFHCAQDSLGEDQYTLVAPTLIENAGTKLQLWQFQALVQGSVIEVNNQSIQASASKSLESFIKFSVDRIELFDLSNGRLGALVTGKVGETSKVLAIEFDVQSL